MRACLCSVFIHASRTLNLQKLSLEVGIKGSVHFSKGLRLLYKKVYPRDLHSASTRVLNKCNTFGYLMTRVCPTRAVAGTSSHSSNLMFSKTTLNPRRHKILAKPGTRSNLLEKVLMHTCDQLSPSRMLS